MTTELYSSKLHAHSGIISLSYGELGAQQYSAALQLCLDCSLHRKSAIQDLQVLAGAQQCSAALELWQIVPYTTSAIQDLQVLARAQQQWLCGRLFLTLHICHPGPAGPGRSSAVLSSTGVVADCSLHRTSAIQDLQVLAGAQHSALLKLWQIVPYTTDLPSRTCRSWQELK